MSKPTKPAQKPTQRLSNLESDLEFGTTNPKKDFYMAVMNMSWQLAIVVLIPLFIGVKIDDHYYSSPLWTLIMLAIALVCASLIVWRQFQMFTPKINHKPKEHHS